MASQPWYSVAPNDIFPEEFRLFFSGNQRARKVFDSLHSDLYEASFWQRLQERFAVAISRTSSPTAASCALIAASRLFWKPHDGNNLSFRHGQASFGADDYDKLSPLGERQAAGTGTVLA